MRLNLIQALRAFAAYFVLLYHIRAIEMSSILATGSHETPLVGGPFTNGWVGVDLFFAISGFIMVYVTFSRPSGIGTVKEFLLARFFRIYPTWWLFAALIATYFLLTRGVPYDAEMIAPTGMSGAEHLIRSALLLPQPTFPVLGVGWTLVHEIWFYLIFAIILLFPRRGMPVWLILWAMLVTGAALLGYSSSFSGNFIQLAASPLTLEFLAGAMAGYLFVTGAVRSFGTFALVFGGLLFLTAAWLHPAPGAFTLEWGRALIFSLPCALMVYGAASSEGHLTGRLSNILKTLGDWSFSLYLCHHITLAAIRAGGYVVADQAEVRLQLAPGTLDIFRLGSEGWLDNAFFLTAGVILPTMIAAITYYLFERPVMKILNSTFRKRQPDEKKARLAESVAP